MNALHSALMVTLCITATMTTALAGEDEGPGVDPIVEGLIIVRLIEDPEFELQDFIDQFNVDHPQTPVVAEVDSIPGRRIHLLEMDVSAIPPQQLPNVLDDLEEQWEDEPPTGTRWLEFEYLAGAPEGKTGSTWVTGIFSLADYENQYGTSTIRLGDAHPLSTGAGTVVAVLDTGIDSTHAMLADAVVDGGWNFIDDTPFTGDIGNGADDDDDGDIDEMTGHGTFVSGLIRLIAPDTRLLPVVVLDDDGVGRLWTVTKGMFYAIDRGVEVINMSLTSTYRATGVEDALDEAAALGIVVVGAAGNFDRDDPRENPAMQSNCFGVAATDHADIKADFSNYHENLFIAAPGATTCIAHGCVLEEAVIGPVPGGDLVAWEGTSFATCFVSGTAALLRSQHPEWRPSPSTYVSIRSLLANSADNIYPLNPGHAGEQSLGVGRLDAGGAVSAGPPAPLHGDLNADGAIDVDDLVLLITDWGKVHSSADLDGSGMVDVDDLVMLMVAWG